MTQDLSQDVFQPNASELQTIKDVMTSQFGDDATTQLAQYLSVLTGYQDIRIVIARGIDYPKKTYAYINWNYRNTHMHGDYWGEPKNRLAVTLENGKIVARPAIRKRIRQGYEMSISATSGDNLTNTIKEAMRHQKSAIYFIQIMPAVRLGDLKEVHFDTKRGTMVGGPLPPNMR